jgi:hypothetical protein
MERTRKREDLVEEPIKVLDGLGDILVLLPERKKNKEIFEALVIYWGSFICLVWYYCEFNKQGKNNGILETAQQIFRISRKPKNARNIRPEL